MVDQANDPRALTDFAFDFLETQGASKVGVATAGTLAGGPPSTDCEPSAEFGPIGSMI
jgi:hypothetical protein